MSTRRKRSRRAAGQVLLLTLALAGAATAAQPGIQPVTGQRIEDTVGEARNWLSYGRTYSEQRYSPLTKINADNANRLGLAWFAELDTQRGQEATPLVIDGVIYVSTAWSLVKAYDGRSGKLLWSMTRKSPASWE
jgi:quinohemoprotein ethanol dehydrogenase